MKRRRTGHVLKVLSTLENVARAYIHNPGRTSGALHSMFREFDALQMISDDELENAVRYAKRRKYITIRERPSGTGVVEISRVGKQLLRRKYMRTMQLPKHPAWDGKWRIVIFDIPERLKTSRDAFAALLKRLGFRTLQKSVFVYPLPCERELTMLIRDLELEEYVHVLVAKSITREEELLRAFKLSR